MPGFDRDQVAIDNTVENRQLGSILLTLGWIILWADAMLSVFFFISIRNGSWFWPIWLGVLGVIGLALVLMGGRYRRAVGATKLGRREIEHTRAEVAQDRAENDHVA